MKRIFFILCLLVLLQGGCSSKPAQAPDARQPAVFENQLKEFTSDGCSRFPNGIPWLAPDKWLSCCVHHDVAYWAGGTFEQRLKADEDLRVCVNDKVGMGVGDLMYTGVRAGGDPSLPTSWRWGYGWTIPRGYAPLADGEQRQVMELSQRLPKNLDNVSLQDNPIIPDRESVSKNYCVDLAAVYLASADGRSFEILESTEVVADGADGSRLTLLLRTSLCEEPYKFTFHLLRKDACTATSNEVLARGRIRFQKMEAPQSCRQGAY